MLSKTSLKYPTTILYGCDIDTNTHIKGNHQKNLIFSFLELGIYICRVQKYYRVSCDDMFKP